MVEVDGKEQGLACVAALIKYMEVRTVTTLTNQCEEAAVEAHCYVVSVNEEGA